MKLAPALVLLALLVANAISAREWSRLAYFGGPGECGAEEEAQEGLCQRKGPGEGLREGRLPAPLPIRKGFWPVLIHAATTTTTKTTTKPSAVVVVKAVV